MAITSGPFAGRLAEIAYSAAGSVYTDVEKVNSPRFSGSNDTAEVSSNDSGGHKEFIYTWQSGTVSFEMVADEAAVGQEAVWAAFLAKTTLYWRMRPRGNAVGTSLEIIFQGLITSIEVNADKGDKTSYTVTVQKTGAPTRQTQV